MRTNAGISRDYVPPVHDFSHDSYVPHISDVWHAPQNHASYIPPVHDFAHDSYVPKVNPSFPEQSALVWAGGRRFVRIEGVSQQEVNHTYAQMGVGIAKAAANTVIGAANFVIAAAANSNPMLGLAEELENERTPQIPTFGYTNPGQAIGALYANTAIATNAATEAVTLTGRLMSDGLKSFGIFSERASAMSTVPELSSLGEATTLQKSYVGAGEAINLEPGLYNIDPRDIRFTQSDASPYFRNGTRVDDLITGLRNGTVSPNDLSPIEVVSKEGKLFSIDNRRLLAYNNSQVDSVPVQIVSSKDPVVNERLRFRNDPILGEGQYIVVVTSAERAAAQELLRDYGLIKGIQLGQ